MITRRNLLRTVAGSALATSFPEFAFANTGHGSRLVLVILRGAVDGLALAAPYGDPDYRKMRGELALPEPGQTDGLLDLDGFFGLHPALGGISGEFRKNRALVVHAVASPYRGRSHFDGQDVLENGAAGVGLLRDGWLNRALGPLGGSLGNERAIAMAQNTPLVLRGTNSVTSWAPSVLPDAEESTLQRLQDLYTDDEFFATRLAQARRSRDIAAGEGSLRSQRNRGNEAAQLRAMMEATARFLTSDGGPQITVLEAGGWDTHANQGGSSGALANRLSALDAGLMALATNLGETWDNTVVAIVTEFGRTIRANGTRGTDHGTASAAILIGGAVKGGRVIANWPGLRNADMYEQRDLMPTLDTRSVFKGLLADHLALPSSFLEQTVFPDSASARPMQDLIRS